jgi:long-chain acyl-CoA synthetase
MASELDKQYAAIFADLTAPGAPFEIHHVERGSCRLPAFRHAPPSLPALFAQFCHDFRDVEFLVDGDIRLTFGEVHALACRAARGLITRHGVRPGDRIGIAARNSANWVITYMGVLIAGGCAALLNGWWTGGEMAQGLAIADCKLLLADPQRAGRLREDDCLTAIVTFDHGDAGTGLAELLAGPDADAIPLPQPDSLDIATILFTSGSTGQSRAAFSDHRAVVQATLNFTAQSLVLFTQATSNGEHVNKSQTMLVSLPLFHVTGEVAILLQSFVTGRRLILLPKWDAEHAMQLIERERVTAFIGVPLMSHEMATHPRKDEYDLSSCLSIAAGAAPRPVEHVGALRKAFPWAWPMIGYGLTETNAVGCANYNENHVNKPDSAGPASRPLSEVAVLDEDGKPVALGTTGEVAVRSICNFSGYWRDPEATAATHRPDGFVLTGDLGRMDADGYLYIVDRKKDIIIRGGENIACTEVENAIFAHPAVAEASVFGLPDARFGEVPVAVFRTKPGQQLEASDLAAHVAARLAGFKVPVRFWHEDHALPRLGTEKIDRRALKARYSQGWEGVTGGV